MANTFKNYALKSAGTAAANVYAPGAGVQATVIGMTVSNLTTSPIAANVILNTASANLYLVRNATIAPGGALVPVGGDQKLVIEAGDYLQVNTSVAAAADVVVSALEIT